MFNKRLIVVLIMLFIAVGAVSTVSAADLNATDDAAMGDKLQTIEENAVLQENDSVESDMSQNITGAGESMNLTLLRKWKIPLFQIPNCHCPHPN